MSWIYTHLAMSLDHSANEVINLLLLLEPDVSRWAFHPPTEALIAQHELQEKERKIHVLFLLSMEYFEMKKKIILFIINHLALPNVGCLRAYSALPSKTPNLAELPKTVSM